MKKKEFETLVTIEGGSLSRGAGLICGYGTAITIASWAGGPALFIAMGATMAMVCGGSLTAAHYY